MTNFIDSTCTSRLRQRRRGLAPLELLLSLLPLLAILAVLINVGTAATWKLKSDVAARSAVWRTRWPRPTHGPPPSQLMTRGISTTVDQGTPLSPQTDPAASSFPALTGLLGTSEVRVGMASATRRFSIARGWGDYRFVVSHSILDGCGQYRQTGLKHNDDQRLRFVLDPTVASGDAP